MLRIQNKHINPASYQGCMKWGIILFAVLLSPVAVLGAVYDDFSSNTLNASLWTIEQDEGISGLETAAVVNEQFTLQQTIAAEAASYLKPTHVFIPGDVFSWDMAYLSGSDGHGALLVIRNSTSDVYRVILFNDSIFGSYTVDVTFFLNNVKIKLTAPNGQGTLNLPVENTELRLMIGGFTQNGTLSMTLDNAELEEAPEPGENNLVDKITIKSAGGDVTFLSTPLTYEDSKLSASFRIQRDLLRSSLRYTLSDGLECRISRASFDPNADIYDNHFSLIGTGILDCTIPVSIEFFKEGNQSSLTTRYGNFTLLDVQDMPIQYRTTRSSSSGVSPGIG